MYEVATSLYLFQPSQDTNISYLQTYRKATSNDGRIAILSIATELPSAACIHKSAAVYKVCLGVICYHVYI